MAGTKSDRTCPGRDTRDPRAGRTAASQPEVAPVSAEWKQAGRGPSVPPLPAPPRPCTPYLASGGSRPQVMAGLRSEPAAPGTLRRAEGGREPPPHRAPARGPPAPPRARRGHVGPSPRSPLTCLAEALAHSPRLGNLVRAHWAGPGRASPRLALWGWTPAWGLGGLVPPALSTPTAPPSDSCGPGSARRAMERSSRV